MAPLLSEVLSDDPPLLVRHAGKTRAIMSFPDGADTMRLESNVGEIELYLGQELEAYERPKSEKRYTLRTCEYWYRLYPRTEGQIELLRWEYVNKHRPEGANHCRNHLHIHTRVELPGGTLDLKKVHLPTGYVLIEEVLRFLFMDLDVKPATPDWPAKLAASEEVFRRRFSPWGPPNPP